MDPVRNGIVFKRGINKEFSCKFSKTFMSLNISNGVDKQVIVNNLLISYSQAAGNGNKTLLFLHGWRSSKEVWQNIALRIKDKGLRIIALDLPGFGKSQIPQKPMTVGDYADITAEFIKKLGLKNVIVVGHSFGGRVGIKLSSQHPELVSKLVLVDSAGFAMDQSKKSLMGAAAKIVKPFFAPEFMQPLRKKVYQKIGAEDYVATPELQQTFVNITSEDLSQDLKKIQVPTLILNGENDEVAPLEYGKKMNSLIRNSQFVILPNAGHFSFLDKPEEFVSSLEKFL